MRATTASPSKSRLTIKRTGLWLFILSESFLFGALIGSRFYLQGVYRAAEVNQPLGFVISVILLLSSLTAYRCEAAIAYGDRQRFRRNILFTMGLGILFLFGVGLEWAEGFHFFPPATTGFGTVFFTLTGFHALHVVTGLLALLAVYIMGQKGHFISGSYWGTV